MMKQDHLLDPAVPEAGAATGPTTCTVPEQRLPEQRLPEQRPAGPAADPEPEPAPAEERRATRLRVDARRNLESVLRAAREVFGELGYDAPMEEVARRAGVGVGTVYRRFPSKEVLVQRIAAEEVAWLTARAREALYGPAGPWEALAGYLANAVGTGAGRLLPPEAFGYAEELARVPEQRPAAEEFGYGYGAGSGPGEAARLPGGPAGSAPPHADPRLLLQLLAALVARAASAGELRPGVTVSEIVLVLTAAVPPSIGRTVGPDGTDPGERLLQILLDGLRAA